MAVTFLESESARRLWLNGLDRGEREPTRRMVAAYRQSLVQIEDDVRALLLRRSLALTVGDRDEIAAASTRLSLIYNRAMAVREAAASAIANSDLPDVSAAQLGDLAPKAFALGADLGYARLEGAGVRFERMNDMAARQAAARLSAQTASAEWVRRFAGAQSETAVQSLVRSVALGRGVPEMVRDMRNTLEGVGTSRIRTFVRTEMIGAMRDGNLDAYRANPGTVTGWTWNAAPTACVICQGMHGSRHPLGEAMYSHPNCRCSMDPITYSLTGITGQAFEDTAAVYEDPNARLRGMPAEQRRRILGPARARAFDAGRLDVRDVPARTEHPVWGPGLRAKSLRELNMVQAPVAPPPAPPAAPPPPDAPAYVAELNEIRDRIADTLGELPAGFLDDAAALEHLSPHVDDVLRAGEILQREIDNRLAATLRVNDAATRGAIEEARDKLATWSEFLRDVESRKRYRGQTADVRRAKDAVRQWQGKLDELTGAPPAEVTRVTREVLDEAVGLSGDAEVAQIMGTARPGSVPQALDAVRAMVPYLPQAWVRRMAEFVGERGVRFGISERGYWQSSTRTLTVGNYNTLSHVGRGHSVALHEMTHWAEYAMPAMRRLEWAFYTRRTSVDGVQERLRSLRSLLPGHGYSSWEKAREDKWGNLYMGKDYERGRDGAWEVMTMGMETTYRTRSGAIDDEHRRFVLGILALLR